MMLQEALLTEDNRTDIDENGQGKLVENKIDLFDCKYALTKIVNSCSKLCHFDVFIFTLLTYGRRLYRVWKMVLPLCGLHIHLES